MTPRTQSLLLAGTGSLYFVDLFVRWVPRHPGGTTFGQRVPGWTFPIAQWSGLAVLGLVLVEFARIYGLWPGAASSLVTIFLAAGSGILVLSALVNLRWNYSVGFDNWAYGAWIALVAGLFLVALAGFRGTEHRQTFGLRTTR